MATYRIIEGTREHWRECIEMSFKYEGRGMPTDELDVLKRALGENNERLIVAIDNGTNEVIGFSNIGLYQSEPGYDSLAHLGAYFVVPTHRGKGIGTKIFEAAVAPYRETGINIGLVAVPAMALKYASKFGFDKVAPHYQMKRYQISTDNLDVDRLNRFESEYRIVDVDDSNMNQVARFDAQIIPSICRESAVKVLFRDPLAIIKVVMNKKDGEIAGLCSIRELIPRRLRIRAWYATNEMAAECGLISTLELVGDLKRFETIECDAPIANSSVKLLLDKLAGGTIIAKEPIPTPFQFTLWVPVISFAMIYSLNRMNFA